MSSHSDREHGRLTSPADLDAARRGDLQAFNRLVAAHQDQLYAFTRRALGDEQAAIAAARVAVEQAARNLRHCGDWQFHLWLLHWAAQACLERLRHPAAASRSPRLDTNSAPAMELESSLGTLPAELRLAIIVVDVIGLNYAEAAIVLGASRERVRGLVAEARWRLMGQPPRGALSQT